MILDDISRVTRMKKAHADHFIYGASFNPLPAAPAILQVNVPISNESDFILCELCLSSFSAVGVPVVAPDYLCTIIDTGSSRNLQDIPVHVANMFGTALLPFKLPEPKLFAANSIIQITLTNLTALASRVEVSLIGFKLFYFQGFNRGMLSSLTF